MKSKWLLPGALVIVVAVIIAVWQSMPKNSLVGEWKIVGSGFSDTVNASIVFSQDGTFTLTSAGQPGNIPMTPEGQEPLQLETIIVGTWEIKGKQLHMIYDDHDTRINGQIIEATSIEQGVEKQKILGNLNTYSPYDLRWKGSDEFETKSKDQTRHYTRMVKN